MKNHRQWVYKTEIETIEEDPDESSSSLSSARLERNCLGLYMYKRVASASLAYHTCEKDLVRHTLKHGRVVVARGGGILG